MQTRTREAFTTVRTEGAILPSDLLRRVIDRDRSLDGLSEDAYHIEGGQKLNERINYSWNRLLGQWATFQAMRAKLPPDDFGITLTREKWLLPLFNELGYRRLPAAERALEIDGKDYPISHVWQYTPKDPATPIHLVGCGVDLDRRTARVAGAARTSPHSLVQELLNRSETHLWGIVSNGLRLRVLRDNASLTRQAYVEFDLEAMMDGEVYSDFVLLWMLCHESRVEGERAEACWLEKWSKTAQTEGTRALDQLRKGVERAITSLGRGFLEYPANRALRDRLQSGDLDKQDYYRQLLRMVYRLLFLFVAEDRGSLLDPSDAAAAGRERYARWYSTARLRKLAQRRRTTRHPDLYQGLRLIMERLGDDRGCADLALSPLGSYLWSDRAVPDLIRCDISNEDLLEAIRALAYTEDARRLRAVDYKNLGSEELGSVYESLLELHPELNVDAGTFELRTAAGNERKTTGSYYTPTSLILCLLDSALDPVLAEARTEDAILALKVCDPACGSGHFLIAAAHRMARRLAAVRTGDEEPAPEAVRTALRDVIGHCIYGVDVNEMAVELCKVSLWMEALEPGKPLSFLEHRIVCGNSLLGTTPALLEKGIPEEAFTPIEGDDRKGCSELKKRNKQERKGQMSLPFGGSEAFNWQNVERCVVELNALEDASIADVHLKEQRHALCFTSAAYHHQKRVADAWCAAFVWRKVKEAPEAITEDVFRRLQGNPNALGAETRAEVERLARQYNFLHWHLAFPDVFHLPGEGERAESEQAGWSGGFDVVLGNPPWDRVKIQEQEWFAARSPEIANAANAAARKKRIAALQEEDPALYGAFLADCRQAEGESHLLRNGGRHPLCGRGDVNTYAVFAETMRVVLGGRGRLGCIVPSGIATDDTTKHFFRDLVARRHLVSLLDFENALNLFPGVGHGRFKFCLLTVSGHLYPAEDGIRIVFYAHGIEDLKDPARLVILQPGDIALLNPNTRTCPILRGRRDAEITKRIYANVPVLILDGPPEENPWRVRFLAMLHMANDSGLFRTAEQLQTAEFGIDGSCYCLNGQTYVPLYEAKMMHHFTHRWGDYAMRCEGSLDSELPTIPETTLADPAYAPMPRYWVSELEVVERLSGRWERSWLMGWRDICRAGDERTVLAGLLPRLAVGHTYPLLQSSQPPQLQAALYANLCAFVFDYCARQKIGGTHLSYNYLQQLPILPPETYAHPCPWDPATLLRGWILPRVLELTYTAWDLQPFAQDCGYDGPPFRWDDARRFLLRCELDAAYFHLYGIPRDDVDYIMDTFPIVRRKDEASHGEYRTKRAILEVYDAMQAAASTGIAYRTTLDPPAADPRVAHPPREPHPPDPPPVKPEDSASAVTSVDLCLTRVDPPGESHFETRPPGEVSRATEGAQPSGESPQMPAPAPDAPPNPTLPRVDPPGGSHFEARPTGEVCRTTESALISNGPHQPPAPAPHGPPDLNPPRTMQSHDCKAASFAVPGLQTDTSGEAQHHGDTAIAPPAVAAAPESEPEDSPDGDLALTVENFPNFGSVIRGCVEMGWERVSDLPVDWSDRALGFRGVGATRLAKFEAELIRLRSEASARRPLDDSSERDPLPALGRIPDALRALGYERKEDFTPGWIHLARHAGIDEATLCELPVRVQEGLKQRQSSVAMNFPAHFDATRFEWEQARVVIPLHWSFVVPRRLLEADEEARAREILEIPAALPPLRELTQVRLGSIADGSSLRRILYQLAVLGCSFAPRGAVADTLDPTLTAGDLLGVLRAWKADPPRALGTRNLAIVLARMPGPGMRRLEDLGREHGLTRERVRQIAAVTGRHVTQPGYLALAGLAQRVVADLEGQGGTTTLQRLASPLGATELEMSTLIGLLGLVRPTLALHPRTGLVTARGLEAVDALLADLCEHVRTAADEEACITTERLVAVVAGFAAGRGLDAAVVEPLVGHSQREALRNAGAGAWIPRASSRAEAFAALFKREFLDGLDVYRNAEALMDAVSRTLPQLARNARAVTVRLLDHPDVLLWGNGFYVHRDNVRPDLSALEPVASWIVDRFAEGVDAVHVHGAHAAFATQLKAAGIPNPQALYTLLRRRDDTRLRLSRYPDVGNPATHQAAEAVTTLVEGFARDRGGTVSLATLRKEFLETRGWPSYRLDQALVGSRLVTWEPGVLRLLDEVALSLEQVGAVMEMGAFLEARTQQDGLISVKLLPQAVPDAWDRAGLPSPRSAWEILRRLFGTRLAFTPPLYVQAATPGPGGWWDEVVDWIRSARAPVSRASLLAEFCGKRGLDERNVDAVFHRNEALARTAIGEYAHLDNLEWGEAHQDRLLRSIDEAVATSRTRLGLPLAIADGVAARASLPALPDPFRWTGDLVASLSLHSDRHLYLGGCLVPRDNGEGIQDWDQLIALVLWKRFGGASLEGTLLEALRDLHVVIGDRIPQLALNPPAAIEAVDGTVRLTAEGRAWLGAPETAV